ncbi:Flavohemoprotein [Polystyrenella longa]|uniref:Flavohemoprotein n=1 Tax=Polystyrenella longa TaxID=2528007 RepID=A0A518CMY5_9PLAN|nr:2Fe-2S iron-sulfur cluster-binding protein [Polystyrenella longa]QDU80573.1 Flavohemoprotein [Polystyrenella longa]
MLQGIQQLIFWTGTGLIGLVSLRLAIACLRSCSRWWQESRLSRQHLILLQSQLQQSRRNFQKLGPSPAWQGTRKFQVRKIVVESTDCRSFYLVPEDEKPLPGFMPGQYLTFQLPVPGEPRPVVRCYSLSERPRSEWYRCTIKQEWGTESTPPGKGSSFFHQQVEEGDLLEVKAPAGQFVLDVTDPKPVVLLAAGIGITPLYSMLSTMLHHGWTEPVYLFYSVRDGSGHLYKQTLNDLAVQHRNFKLIVNYTAAKEDDQPDIDYHFAGRLTGELILQRLPSTNFQFYLCGPGGYVSGMSELLLSLQVPETDIHTESFGPSSRATKPRSLSENSPSTTSSSPSSMQVNFEQSGTRHHWESDAESLLDFAEKHGVVIDSACRAGNCGSCLTRIRSGKVKYTSPPGLQTESNECLPCVSLPDGELVLEA